MEEYLKLNVWNETAPLNAVVLGIAHSPGPVPEAEDAYDPKSLEHILAGTYPKEHDMILEIESFSEVFKKYGVNVLRPVNIENVNQIFTRDIAFVIGDSLFKSNILPDREDEIQAIEYIIEKIDPAKIVIPPADVHVEGGDVMLWDDHILVGTYKGSDYPNQITARTNVQAVKWLKELFPDMVVREFDLVKSKTDARKNALHLDCVFQPVGKNLGIIHKEGFRDPEDYNYLLHLFGKENLFHINANEMYEMFSNVFSISPETVVSDKSFSRLNNWLREHDLNVEEIHYREIAKQEGLLRCSTLPLNRYV